eukprot:XP_016659390.1 PREDICTED: protein aubergine-like [Acyrthosiphon pisum]
MNNLFDALNRKFRAEGIKHNNSKDLKTLKEAMIWLNTWESNVDHKLIDENYFLSRQTAEGLRMTIQSTLDLIEVLLNEYNFKYVLTSKTNQDRLEVNNTPDISIADLKNIINDQNITLERTEMINKLREKLDDVVQDGCWELDDVFVLHLIPQFLNVSFTIYLVEIIMDQNPLEPLYGENDQQVNEAEFDRPNSRNNQNIQLFQGKYFLDGATLYSLAKYEPKKFTIKEDSGSSGSLVIISINHICEVEGSEMTTILLKIVQNCLRHAPFIQVGSYFYDPEATIINKRLGVKYWPGYSFGIRECNDELVLSIELSDKFKTAETVLDFLNVSCGNNRNRFSCLMNNFKAIIIGTVVQTLHNNELYKIHAVDENLNIYSTFINEDGSTISYKDYYKQKWNITILNDKQPMLKTLDHDDGTLYLVPELCSITEFNDVIGKKHLVKELSQYTNYGPNKTINKYNQFLGKLEYTKKFCEALDFWHLSISRKLIRISGRVLPSVNLRCLNHIIPVGDQGNWTDQLKRLKMSETPYVENWVVLAPSKYFSIVKQYVCKLRHIAETMAFTLPEPEIVKINDVSQISYMNHLDEIVNRNISFILCVIKSRNSDIYNRLNRKLCLEASVPSHLLSLKQVRYNDLSSTYAKTAIRINCKLGGVPWSVADFGVENIMVVGLDMYQDPLNKNKYFCAVMVSMNGYSMRYFSYVKLVYKKDISKFYVSSITDALSKYKDLNQKLPRGVLIYRDGLKYDDESFQETCISEVNLMLAKCFESYCGGTVPFAYILVKKSDETKFFTHYDSLNYQNPLPGTIVDSDITDPNIFDFFLISHTVKSGSVSPTYYCILFNSIPQFLVDELHMITYFLTHMYYKSPHTIQVPAPCQLAYDLAYFSANTLKSTDKILLHGYPFFF